MEKLPTIKEIAKQLNVSESTVSRALNNHPRIGLPTKMRVQQLAKELNYEPNTHAVSLMQKKTFVIGVVLPSIREEFFSEAITGIEATAQEHNYTILFGQSHDDPAQEKKVVEAMKKQRVDGLLISLSKKTRQLDHLQGLDRYGIPVVYFDRVPAMAEAHKVYCNLYKGTIELVGWLVSRGHKRIALLNGPEKMQASKERLQGYIDGLAKKKIKVDMRLVETTDLSKESTYTALMNLLALKQPPKAVISFNDYVHMDAVQCARQQNICVNKDIVFASSSNLPITCYTADPPLVSLEQHPFRQGEKAMEIMISLLATKTKEKNFPVTYFTEEIPSALVMYQKNGLSYGTSVHSFF